ncbi:MAG: radical SAM protein [Anaerolineae bacterium]|nr:radical SAM protein [Anaerolineae bacterium]
MLNKRNLYRFPWSLNDNPIAWLEVTDICNIHCEGCYRQRLTDHKPLDEVKAEILFFKKWRNPDNVSIAGGEPLLHPQIDEIVTFISNNGLKPILLTNGVALTPERLRELKKAGLAGFTIHIDSYQNRPHWPGKTEAELNELRQYYTDMIAAEGGLHLTFNSTVYPSTLPEVPEVVRWGQANMGRVDGLVFITFRTVAADWGYAARDQSDREVDALQLSYISEHFEEKLPSSIDIYQVIKDNFPQYEAAAYLGGTARHTSFKWLLGGMIGSKKAMYGSIGKKAMEIGQIGHHLFKGTYMAYMLGNKISPLSFLLSPWDKTVRQTARHWLTDIIRRPGRLLNSLRIQSITIIQGPDFLPDGQVDMCENCPDMTLYEGKLVNSCRLDEYRLFGGLLSAVRQPQETVEDNKTTAAVAPVVMSVD